MPTLYISLFTYRAPQWTSPSSPRKPGCCQHGVPRFRHCIPDPPGIRSHSDLWIWRVTPRNRAESVARADARRRCPPGRSRAAPCSKPGSTSCPSPGPGPSQRSKGCRFQRSCPAHARTIMTHFTTRERGTGTVLRRPDNSRRQGSISSLIPRLNRVHHSTFVFVEISRSFEVYLDTPSLLASSRVNIFFLHFRKFFLSKFALELEELSAFQLVVRWIVSCFLLVFIAVYSTAQRNVLRANLRGIRRLFVVVYHNVHQLRLERDRFSLGPSRRSRNRPRIPSPSDSNLPRGVCKWERVASTSYTIWHFVNSRKTPDSPSCCCQWQHEDGKPVQW